MLFYQPFYQKYGIRKVNQLMTPPLPKLEILDLPKESILHYISTSPIDYGPAADDFLFRNITRPIMVGHVVENGDFKGMPRKLSIAVDPLIRTFHVKNRRFKLMRDLVASSRDPNTLVMYNYGMIPHLYRYMRSYYSEYYKWWNIQSAVWKKISEISSISDRQQFIVCKLPTILPSIPDLKIGCGPITQKAVKLFNNPESLLILELWKWFGHDRKTSIIDNISTVSLDKVNLIFQESGRWFVLNLGLVNRWRIATPGELEINPAANVKGLASDNIQRRFLRLMISLFQIRTVATDAMIEGTNKIGINKTGVSINTSDSIDPNKDDENEQLLEPEEQEIQIAEVEDNFDAEHNDGPNSTGDDFVHDAEFEKQLAADLFELETISSKVDDTEVEDTGPEIKLVGVIPSLEEGVTKVCDRLADRGLLSAAEYRRYNALASTYKTIVAPDGKTTLDKFIQIKPEVLSVDNVPKMKDTSAITDKTMLSSSLQVFDSRYIKEVMAKDVAGMVLNIQNAGISITGYEVENIEDVMGSFNMHTVRITPVEGTSSTLRFKLPAMEEDGTYLANGTKYRMRKQRGD